MITEFWSVETLVNLHLVATAATFGLLWFVQIVHYPMFDRVGESAFLKYEADHCRLTAYAIALPMGLELLSAGLLILFRPDSITLVELWIGHALLGAGWASTLFIQTPLHRELLGGFSENAHQRLVRTNWIRTVIWGLRTIWVFRVMG